jgi:hypothetical protein
MTDLWKQRIATKKYDESIGGIMLCGINWGGGGGLADDAAFSDEPSFFSDTTTRNANYRYQSKIREWFASWGFELRTDDPGRLERSISQTNWIVEGSPHANEIYTVKNLVGCASQEFLPVLTAVAPRLLIFFGIQRLPNAFAHRSLRGRLEELFGPTKCELEDRWYNRLINGRRFRATTMALERCFVLGLPHPTPQSGALARDDVAQMGRVFREAMQAGGFVRNPG